MGTFSALLAIFAGNSPVTGEFPAQKPVTRSFDVFFDLCLNKGWVNSREAGELRHHRTHYDVTVMKFDLNFILPNPMTWSPQMFVRDTTVIESWCVRSERHVARNNVQTKLLPNLNVGSILMMDMNGHPLDANHIK